MEGLVTETERCTRRCVRATKAGVCTWCANSTATALDDMLNVFLDLWMARTASSGAGPKVGGSKTPPAPVRVEVLDHQDVMVDVLGSWAGQVAAERKLVPPYTLQASLAVLHAQHDWAVQQPWATDYCEEVRDLLHTARVLANLYDPRPQLLDGVQCRSPKCDLVGTLFRVPGSQYVECGSCGNLLTESEYREWTGMLAAAAKSDTRHTQDDDVTPIPEAC